MDPQLSGGCDFEFAFNSEKFSDRVLRIEIAPDLPEGEPGAGRGRKRRREEVTIKRKGDEPLACDFPLGSTDFSKAPRVKSMYISSAILAAKSPYFLKLFSSGGQESDRRQTTLQINASEEAALMELLGFIYRGKLTTISPALLLDVLMAADKFEVSSCTRLCMQLLMSLPMTTEYALLYLELPSTVSMPSAVQPLTDAAKEFLTNKYRDTSKLQHEVMNLPLAGIEVIFCSNNLRVTSEDAIYDLLVKWARARYPEVEERREIMASHLARLIRFPYMTCKKLGKLLTSNDLDKQLATKLVTEALFFKAEAPHRRRALASGLTACGQFAGRAYTCRPTKVVEFDRPHQQCIIYLDLKREECAKLFPSGRIYSQAFHLGSHGFFLSGHCNVERLSSKHCFGVFLYMLEKPAVTFMVNYEFAARVKPSGEFVGRHKGCYNFTRGKAVGYRNLFGMLWSSFMADDSPCFINDILHLRAQLDIK